MKINWLYCSVCGWQTDDPGTASAKCCTADSLRYVSFKPEELVEYRPLIDRIGLKAFVEIHRDIMSEPGVTYLDGPVKKLEIKEVYGLAIYNEGSKV